MGRLKTIFGVLGVALFALGLALTILGAPAVYAQNEEPSPVPEDQAAATEEQQAAPAQEEQPAPLKYEGVRECQSCHRDMVRNHQDTAHAQALLDTDDDKNLILGDFSLGDDVRSVTLPGEDSSRPFTADDIVFAIGSGVNAQAYVTKVDDTLRVLPAQWNVTEGQWQALSLADSWDNSAYDFVTSCAGCHTTGLNVEDGKWEDDGVMCEACHGPAEQHVELAEDAGRRASDEEIAALRAAINPGIDPQVCGSCHSRGEVPAGAPAFSTTYRPGGTLTVEGEYVPFGPDDPVHFYLTGQASQPNMQFNEWLASAHSTSLEVLPDDATDECLTCHAGEYAYNLRIIAEHESGDRAGLAPELLTVATAQFGVGCINCHDPHSQGELPTALLDEPYALCTSCHTNRNSIVEGVHHPVKEMYEGAPLVEGVPSMPSAHFTAEDGPDCLTCHMPQMPFDGFVRDSHSMRPVLPGEAAASVEGLVDTCSRCHSDIASPEALQAFIENTQNGVKARIDAIRAAMPPNPPDWAVIAIDFVEGDGSYGVHNYVYADEILDLLEENLGLSGR
ncbi:MAG: cytochrome c3 family protein [Anaerolineae bacterium]